MLQAQPDASYTIVDLESMQAMAAAAAVARFDTRVQSPRGARLRSRLKFHKAPGEGATIAEASVHEQCSNSADVSCVSASSEEWTPNYYENQPSTACSTPPNARASGVGGSIEGQSTSPPCPSFAPDVDRGAMLDTCAQAADQGDVPPPPKSPRPRQQLVPRQAPPVPSQPSASLSV